MLLHDKEIPHAFESLYGHLSPILYRGDAPYQMYLGYKDGLPVISAVFCCHANVAGIYLCGSTSEYSKAVVEHLIRKAKNLGYHLVVTLTSSNSKNLYKDLGFKECLELKKYLHE